MRPLILASNSKHRANLLAGAGLIFDQQAADIDERAIEAPLTEAGLLPEDRAQILAEAKAISVSEANMDAMVIGCDQILSLEGEALHKTKNMDEARKRLLKLSGKTHFLHSALALVTEGRTIFRHVENCAMTVNDLSPEYVGRYLATAGPDILSSVGCYQIEGTGIQLFDKIEGDMFSIIGLPVLPLIAALRKEGLVDG